MDVTLDTELDEDLMMGRTAPETTAAAEPAAPATADEPEPAGSLGAVLAQVGPRLRHLRLDRAGTLADLARATGISVSTLSRLESGQRRPSLELLLPIARAYQVPLDQLVAELEVEDPRVQITATRRGGLTIQPLTRHPGGPQSFRMTVPASLSTPQQQTHEGHDWIYVLDGRLRLVLAERDLVLEPGEAAEFDARLPHWFGSTGEGPVEFISQLSPQGERLHLRARARRDQRKD